MKVLVVNTLYPPYVVGGAERSVGLLCESLVRKGLEVIVASLHPSKTSVVETINGVKIYRLPIDNTYWAFDQTHHASLTKFHWHARDIWNKRAQARIEEITQIEAPDVLHTNNLTGFSVSVWAEAQRRSLPIVHTLRDYSLMCRRAALFRHGNNCSRRCLDCTLMTLPSRRQARCVTMVLAISRFVLNAHTSKGYFADTDAKVIYNIMQTDCLSDSSPRQLSNVNSLSFGYLGKIAEEKGIEVLLEATQILKRPDWNLVIAGEGESSYVARLKHKFDDHRIQWHDFTPLNEFMTKVDVMVISSLWQEPLSRVLIESIGFRRPTICAKSGGIPEIAHYGDLIGEYSAHSYQDLAYLMDKAITERRFRETYREKREVNLNELFGESSISSQHIAAYEAVLMKYTKHY